jgi:preprotein translocase subunit SecB
MADEAPGADETTRNRKTVTPQKIYLKDVSFETPHSPGIFLKEWNPALSIEIDNRASMLEDDHFEVVIILTVTVSIGDETAYLAEVHQAGIFRLTGFDNEELRRLHNVYCMHTLYPFACAALADLVSRGGFQQLLLAPVNFEKIYQQRLDATQAAEGTDSGQEATGPGD